MQVKDLTGKWIATATLESDFTLENREAIANNIINQLKEQGATPYIENNCVYTKEGAQFWKLPTIPKIREGILTFTSKGYNFGAVNYNNGALSWGDKPKASHLLSDGFYIETPFGKLTYKLIEKTE